MAKIIKKIVRVLLVITAVLDCGSTYCVFILLQAPAIQTFSVNRLTNVLSQKTGAKITIGEVRYSMFRKIMLGDVLIADHNGDTLLAVGRIDLRVREFKPSEQLYRFGRAGCSNPTSGL